jgi:hypothetical protein
MKWVKLEPGHPWLKNKKVGALMGSDGITNHWYAQDGSDWRYSDWRRSDRDALGSLGFKETTPDDARELIAKWAAGKIATKNGLLYRGGEMIPLPEADQVAREHGYVYAEQFVRALEQASASGVACQDLKKDWLFDLACKEPQHKGLRK